MLTPSYVLEDKVQLTLKDPSRIYIESIAKESLDLLVKELTFDNKAADYAYNAFIHNPRAKYMRNYAEVLEQLKSNRKYCLVKDIDTNPWIYSGYMSYLQQAFPYHSTVSEVVYNDYGFIPWKDKPFDLRDYQQECVTKLMTNCITQHTPSAISLATSLGKSRIIAELIKKHGLNTIVMVPTASIAQQLYVDFKKWFGKYVGLFGDGSKRYDKVITIGIAASLYNVKEGSDEWKELSNAKVFIVDESHTIAANTFEDVAMGLLAKAPYRYFVSGTQTRGDGTEHILNGIIGNIVYTMSAQEGIDKGWLPKPKFCVIKTKQDVVCTSRDPNEVTRQVFYNSPTINKRLGDIINQAVDKHQHQVLVLIDDIAQFKNLLPYIKHKVGFAHGTLTKQHKKYIPIEYQDDDTTDLVEQFNAGKIPVLIGTSCIGMGTNTVPVKTLIYFKGGKSFIAVSQGIGRGFRMAEGKDSFLVFDIDVEDNYILHKHLTERVAIYKSIYDNIKYYD